jgi:hypothetical protein
MRTGEEGIKVGLQETQAIILAVNTYFAEERGKAFWSWEVHS